MLAELDGEGNVKCVYTYGDEILSQKRGDSVSFYLADGHGNVRMLAYADGNITDTYDYDAFGNLISKTGETENNYLYCGEQFDGTTGYYYLRARYMNPVTGTFTSMDSYAGRTADPVTLHKYLYANGNPVMNVDPSGYFTLADLEMSMGIERDLEGRATINYAVLFAKLNIMVTAYDLTKTVTHAIFTGENIEEVVEAVGWGILSSLIISKACKIKALANLVPYTTSIFTAFGLGAEAKAVIDAYESGNNEEFSIRSTQLTLSILSLLFSQCFTGETQIATENGNKRIDEIQVGDLVWAYNFESDKKELCKVKEVFVNETDTLVHITVDGNIINTTEGHPFYVDNKGWVLAGDLNIGDSVVLINGNIAEIDNIQIECLDKPVKVYNFEAEGLHCYYADGVLVHNGCVLVKENGVEIKSYYPNDHGNPVHLHIIGGGTNTKIGPQGKPVKGFPQLSSKQKKVVENNIDLIKKAIKTYQKQLRNS